MLSGDLPDGLPPAITLQAAAVGRQRRAAGAILSLPPVGLGSREGEVTKAFKDSFRSIILDGADIQSTLDAQAKVLNGVLADLRTPCWAPDPPSPVCEVA